MYSIVLARSLALYVFYPDFSRHSMVIIVNILVSVYLTDA